MKVCLVLTIVIAASLGEDCSRAPTEGSRIMCQQLKRWDMETRKELSRGREAKTKWVSPPAVAGKAPALPVPLAGDAAPIPNDPLSCTNLPCLCPYMRGALNDNGCTLPNGRLLTKAVRKELRVMSDDERRRWQRAMNELKGNGQYDRLSSIHSRTDQSGGAHSGPAFLPWHREFMKRMEIAIRLVDPDLFLPYWDSTLDQNMPIPLHSLLWTPLFFGSSDANGHVRDGPFAGWTTLEGRPNILRRLAVQAQLFTEEQLNYVWSQTRVEDILAYTAPQQSCPVRPDWNCLEYIHGNPHIWVGGDMLDTRTSGNDPVFFTHHSFVDLIWESWRKRHQSRSSREREYPGDSASCSNEAHFGDSEMRPFRGVTNRDGLSNIYTDELYEYSARPSCSNQCGSSPYLFCHNQRCMSKLNLGADCSNLPLAIPVCYQGRCQRGRCIASPAVTTVTAAPTPFPTTVRPFVNCFNEHECCNYWSGRGECRRNTEYMNSWCQAACHRCQPSFDISIECSDHHNSCSYWASRGECTNNRLWMAENCRQGCNLCGVTRRQTCSGIGSHHPTTTMQTRSTTRDEQCEHTGGCFNEFPCCETWRRQGKCRNNRSFMHCNCRVSCGLCTPRYPFGTCSDYNASCRQWSRSGECSRNPWMRENCRRSCNSCYPARMLRRICRGRDNKRFIE